MKEFQSFISQNEIQQFYKEKCNENGNKYSQKEFEEFLRFCERDFYQWLRDNLKYFYSGDKGVLNKTIV